MKNNHELNLNEEPSHKMIVGTTMSGMSDIALNSQVKPKKMNPLLIRLMRNLKPKR